MHSAEIALGLDRLRLAGLGLGLERPAPLVVTVGGTNGKGSCVAFLETIYLAAGLHVAAYTSPHVRRFNERFRIDGRAVDDDTLVRSFERVEQCRAGVALTAFEFQTLAVLDGIQESGVDVALLEVGLGGRLDAVNLVDADAAVITSIALDHQEWLGADRNDIGREKAGIVRHGRPAIVADRDPPDGLLSQMATAGADVRLIGRDFDWHRHDNHWSWCGRGTAHQGLPLPSLPGAHQLTNASAAIAAAESVRTVMPITASSIVAGLGNTALPGRFQVLPGMPRIIVDVAHNPAAAKVLAAALSEQGSIGRTYAVLGMFADKDARGVIAEMSDVIDAWYLAGLGGRRGAPADWLLGQYALAHQSRSVRTFVDVTEALQAARADALAGDRIVVFGSFQTAGEALAVLEPPLD